MDLQLFFMFLILGFSIINFINIGKIWRIIDELDFDNIIIKNDNTEENNEENDYINFIGILNNFIVEPENREMLKELIKTLDDIDNEKKEEELKIKLEAEKKQDEEIKKNK